MVHEPICDPRGQDHHCCGASDYCDDECGADGEVQFARCIARLEMAAVVFMLD